MLIKIHENNFSSLKENIKKANKKLEFFNEKIEILNVTKKSEIENSNNFEFVNRFYEIEISDIQQTKINNVEYIGNISFKKDIPMIYTVDENVNLTHMINKNMTCQHCNIKRDRNSYHVFKENGKLKTIGSSCVLKYYGIDIEKALNIYRSVLSEEEKQAIENSMSYGYKADYRFTLKSYIKATAYITNNFTFWEKGISNRKINSMFFLNPNNIEDKKVLNDYADFIEKFDDEKFELLAEKVIIKLSEIKKNESNFNFNIYSAFMDNENEIKKSFSSKNSGLVTWFIFSANKEKKEIKKTEKVIVKNDSDFIGTIKDKIELTVKIINIHSFNNDYGTQIILTCKDSSNNYLKCFTAESSKAGNFLMYTDNIIDTEIKIKATIKSHGIDTYINKGINTKVTTITRIKIID